MPAQTFNESLVVHAKKLLAEAVAHETKSVVAGQLSEAQYRNTTGMIRGLNRAGELLEQALIDVQKT